MNSERLVPKSTSERPAEFSKVPGILTSVFQIIPWAVFLVIYFIGEGICKAPEGEETLMSILCASFFGGFAIIMCIGVILAYKNINSAALSYALLAASYLALFGFQATFSIIFCKNKLGVYPLVVCLPMFILSGALVLFPICKPKAEFNVIYAALIWVVASAISGIILLFHDRQDAKHKHSYLEIILVVIIMCVFCASYCACLKAACSKMPVYHRYFFIMAGTMIFGVIFFLGISILPFFFGLKLLIAKCKAPSKPAYPKPPDKPEKPRSPKVGDSKEIWDTFRKDKQSYREAKQKWKEDKKYFEDHRSEILKRYNEANTRYIRESAQYESDITGVAKKNFCDYCAATTLQVVFCRKALPALMNWYLYKFLNDVPETVKV